MTIPEQAVQSAAPHLASVQVKRLEWRSVVENGRDIQSFSTLGNYVISIDDAPAGCTHYLWVAGQSDSSDYHSSYQNMFEAKAAAQADYSARILSALEPSAGGCPCTLIQQDETCPVGYPSLLCEICDGKGVVQPYAGRAAVLEEAASMLEAKAEAANSRAVSFTEKLSGPLKGRKQSEHWRSEKNHNERIKFYYLKAAAAIRALSSHPQADKPSDDGAQGEGWLPIKSAPKDTYVLAWGDNFHWRGVEKAYVHSDYNGHVGVICKHGVAGTPFSGKDAPTHWRPLPSAPSQEVAGS